MLINDEYGVWPTVGDLLGHTRILDGSALHLQPGSPASDKGVLVALDPPATRSHFANCASARSADDASQYAHE